MTARKPKHKRRHLNSEEMEAMGFADLQHNADEDGWPYPDDDDPETTECYLIQRKPAVVRYTKRAYGRDSQ
jgi:hypothetical protein